jgi:hypothetical protein
MDDNRLLTLPSNERIRLLPHMKLIFEIRDLKFATPATATRAGILYISEGRQWHNMVLSWMDRCAGGGCWGGAGRGGGGRLNPSVYSLTY